MLPGPDDDPSFALQGGIHASVALHVVAKLRDPVAGVALGRHAVFGAAVPEASVDEDRDACPSEDDVGLDAHVAATDEQVLAEPQPPPVQRRSERPLRFGAAAAVPATDASRRVVLRLRVGHAQSVAESDAASRPRRLRDAMFRPG